MKIDFVFLLKAIKENENIFIYRKEKDKTQRHISRFFQLQSKEQAIIIDYPYVDGYSHKRLVKDDPISVIFHSAGFRFHFDSYVKEKIELSTESRVSIPALKIAYPQEILDGNRRSLFRAAVYLDKSIKVKYEILSGSKYIHAAVDRKDDGRGGIEALMVDISEGGVAVKVKRKINIEISDKLKLLFRLEEGEKEIEVEGVVRNIREYPGSDIQVWGIEFTPGKTTEYKRSLQRIACYIMSRDRENVSFFAVNQIVSKNPFVQKIVDNEVTAEVMQMLLAKQLPLSEEEYLESLVYILKIKRFSVQASEQLREIPYWIKEKYIKRMDANHRVAYFILTEALQNSNFGIIANVVNNNYLPVEFLLKIAEEGNARMLKILLDNQLKLIAYPEIMDVMEDNPGITISLKGKIQYLRNFYMEESEAELIPKDEVIPEVTELMSVDRENKVEQAAGAADSQLLQEVVIREKALSILRKINGMSIRERIKLAFIGTRSERTILARDPNEFVVLAVLESPKVTEDEVVKIAQNKKNSKEILVRICENRNWMNNNTIMHSVLRHPKTPVLKTVGILKKLHNSDLWQLSLDKNISPVVRNLARYFHSKKK
jgi:c-di-GMP-binding flagellar brake protein YcgR